MSVGLTPDSVVQSPYLSFVRHGFFTRLGGASEGPYASLNCSTRSEDDPAAVTENRCRVAGFFGLPNESLLGVSQVHGDGVITVTEPWKPGEGGKADAMVTSRSDVALGVITADCGPVLFGSKDGTVVGAAHAGWRGAVGGVLEATVRAMGALGASAAEIVAVVGPCIARVSYEVGADMRDAALAADTQAQAFFVTGQREGHFHFDLAGYCMDRLRRAGVTSVASVGLDTLGDERRFFSHRRRTLAGGGPIGHQISVIAAGSGVGPG
ncbi:peptidoglycan editing factor PgeF [Acetobacter sp.]|jgi:YfiH family protein|uniref:peptidoglycan editing factor PgeF n=1 Tax=Acetobacter sp. TaxID=440 RepID=UPI0025BE263D|nr:peptidoglycan editing factor PgeF [Acetobacter sp.]MCH4092214.1 peptidoglycan editing factor PgeF [Acetobacter sp.]MCI1299869.1 peptidoglycan editing factor PgeF [Acetobacter sp.]MCI1315887.1 peptidoglycan editing factor PgeF [Acetobacter sp.]